MTDNVYINSEGDRFEGVREFKVDGHFTQDQPLTASQLVLYLWDNGHVTWHEPKANK
jgi:hypothetical protein